MLPFPVRAPRPEPLPVAVVEVVDDDDYAGPPDGGSSLWSLFDALPLTQLSEQQWWQADDVDVKEEEEEEEEDIKQEQEEEG